VREVKQKVMCEQDTKAAKSCTNRCPNFMHITRLGIAPSSLFICIYIFIYTVSQKKLSRFVFVRTSSNFHQFR